MRSDRHGIAGKQWAIAGIVVIVLVIAGAGIALTSRHASVYDYIRNIVKCHS